MKAVSIVILTLSVLLFACVREPNQKTEKPILYKVVGSNQIDSIYLTNFINQRTPIDSIIPNPQTAIKVGYIILCNIYGEDQIRSEFPLNIGIDSSKIWTVSGSLPTGYFGGVAVVRINLIDGKVIKIYHSK